MSVNKRSDDAIRRRAEKRGRSFEEQLALDIPNKKSKANGEGVQQSSAPQLKKEIKKKEEEGGGAKRPKQDKDKNQAKNTPTLPPPSGDWICAKCSNKNFPNRVDCNRCGEVKPGAAAACSSSSQKPDRGSSSSLANKQPPRVGGRSLGGGGVGVGVGGGGRWGVATPSADRVEEGALLRRLCALAEQDPQLPEWLELSEEERTRAAILLERSQRHANKRAKKKQEILSHQNKAPKSFQAKGKG